MSDQLYPENPLSIVGDLAPTGFFDPAGLSKGKDEATLRQWRDAELKHGRVCMLASVGLLTQEILVNPLGVDGPAIRHLDLLDEKFPEFGEVFISINYYHIETKRKENTHTTCSLNLTSFFRHTNNIITVLHPWLRIHRGMDHPQVLGAPLGDPRP